MVLLRAFGDKSDLSTSLAKFVDQRYQAAIERNDRFTVALSGGSLPKIMAEGLLKLEGIDYSKWYGRRGVERVTYKEACFLCGRACGATRG